MITALVALGGVAAASPNLDLAYSARYYFQGNKPSFHQIYLVNHTGKGRRQITDNQFDSFAPMWIDRDHLGWVEVYKKLPTSKPGEEPKAKMRIVTYNLATKKRKLIGEVPPHEFFYSPRSLKNGFKTYDSGPNSTLVETPYQVSFRGIKKVAGTESGILDGQEFGDTTGGDTLYPSKKVEIDASKGKWLLTWTVEHPSVSSDDLAVVNQNWVILQSKWKGKTSKFRLHGNRVDEAFIDSAGYPIVHTVYAFEKYRHDDYVYRFSKDFSRCTQVSKDVGLVSLDKVRNLWVGCQPNLREGAMGTLNDKRKVYVTWLYIGDWRTGKQWTIADGLVEVTGTQFRPLK